MKLRWVALLAPVLLAVLPGCGVVGGDSDPADSKRCKETRKTRDEYATAAVEADQRLKDPSSTWLVGEYEAARSRAQTLALNWVNLVVQNDECFTPGDVAKAQTALDRWGQQGGLR